MLIEGDESEVEPLIVAADYRETGIGQRLLAEAVAESKRRGLRYINVRPVAKNRHAIQFFFDSGFSLLARLELSQPLADGIAKGFDERVELCGREFQL